MTTITTEGDPLLDTKPLGEVSEGSWFIFSGIPMMKVTYDAGSMRTIVVAFQKNGIVTSRLRSEALVVPIGEPDGLVLRWGEAPE